MKNKTTFKTKLTYQIKSKLQLLQGEWSNHTTNPIDVKIWLQFMRIEEYLIDFVFDVISAFKGDLGQSLQWIATNPASIWSWLSLECKGIMMNSRYAFKIS